MTWMTKLKRWWRNHKWIDQRDFYILPRSYDIFWLNENEKQEAKKFKNEHRCNFYQYRFTPGPIGVCCKIYGDGSEQDITDYGTW